MTTDTTPQAAQAEERNMKPFARHLPTGGRVLMGLIFLVTGLNGFLNFLPPPKTPLPAGAVAFAGAMLKTGYLFQLVAGTQVIVGALLLSNRFVPLALALIAPVVVNIVLFHAFVMFNGTAAPGIFVAIL